MKYIIAIIQPDRLDDVIAALEEEEIILLTVSDCMGRGRQKGVAEVYRSHVERGGLLHKLKIELAVSNNNVWQAVDAITRGARTGQHRRRQDLRPRDGGVPAHPHGRDRGVGPGLTKGRRSPDSARPLYVQKYKLEGPATWPSG